ncbi:MAG: PLDc N-terminal domain-containing protein [Candidatus Izemoplasmataceae bacterium]|jgi:flagellar biosynthesis protein FliQ|uniref:PLDc N-terminal domain-containing protein n=1 Tax=Liberiplasma polymorphum TaxID=3374570 RepID=UPI003770E4ED
MEWAELLPILLPIMAIELAIRIYAIIDIYKKERNVLYIPKIAWAIIVGLVTFGWVAYFLAGKES